MPISDELKAELNSAVESVAVEQKSEETTQEKPAQEEVKQDVEAGEENSVADEGATEVNRTTEGSGGREGEEEAGEVEEQEQDASGRKELPPALQISGAALTRAIRAGLTFDDAKSFPNEDSLLRVLDSIDAARTKQAAEEPEDDPLDKITLDPEQYEPEVIQVFDSLVAAVKQQRDEIKALRSGHEQVAQVNQQAAAKEVEHWFDGQIKSLGDDFAETLGKGGYSNLPRGSEQLARRDQIADQMAVMIAGYHVSGKPLPTREQVFDAAVRVVLRDELVKTHEKKLAGKLQKREKQHISRVGGNGAKAKGDPFEETAALINEKFFSGRNR